MTQGCGWCGEPVIGRAVQVDGHAAWCPWVVPDSPLLEPRTRQREARAQREAGDSVLTIARRFHVSESTVYAWLREVA